ncbi:MAG: hypothetical protein IT190_08925, partial [Microbacteriaceae bacterium]|nr:hypothetical protein [Microbacteriaceae bacterium]
MTPDLKELERLARAATPGPWTYDGDTWELSAPSRKGKVEIATIETGWTEPMESEQQANIAYILAANPAAILSLIAELEQAKKDAERYRWFADIAVGGSFEKAEDAFAVFADAESCS